jgi:kumamolisin
MSSRIPGSDRPPIPGAQNPQPLASDETITVTVRLRPASPEKAARIYNPGPRRRAGKPLSREALAALVSASPDDARAVETFAHGAGLTVTQVDLPRRTIMLSGPASQVQRAFGVTLQRVTTPKGTFRQRTGAVTVPESLAAIVTGVFGLDDRPQARTQFRVRQPSAAAPTSFSAPTLGGVYEFPTDADGSGQTIGIIELGGGYQASDLQTYFGGLSLSTPTVVPIGVDGGQNAPTGSADGPDGEVMLDLEVAGALANGATLAVYFSPNTDQGFLDAVTTAVHDTTHAPSVISISWGGPESTWTSQAQTAMDEAFAEAVALGIAVCVAAGDNGATDGVSDGKLHVDFPASSPNAIGCGGTSLTVTNGQPVETVWNDLSENEGATGGGFSVTFPTPSWQTAAVAPFKQTGRGVPDVSADADPETGYNVIVDGSSFVLGGTSAVAPLWAALIACCQQASGQRLTDLVSRLYSAKAGFRDITRGGNGGYNAGVGWDPCSGIGVPDGAALLTAVWGAS